MYERPPIGSEGHERGKETSIPAELRRLAESELYGSEGSAGYVLQQVAFNLSSGRLMKGLTGQARADLERAIEEIEGVAKQVLQASNDLESIARRARRVQE